VQGNFLIVCKG